MAAHEGCVQDAWETQKDARAAREGCKGDAQETYPGVTEDAWRMRRRCTEMHLQ